ncbi:hypothetical protein AB7M74_005271 [Bradyrhizobium japonicum]
MSSAVSDRRMPTAVLTGARPIGASASGSTLPAALAMVMNSEFGPQRDTMIHRRTLRRIEIGR